MSKWRESGHICYVESQIWGELGPSFYTRLWGLAWVHTRLCWVAYKGWIMLFKTRRLIHEDFLLKRSIQKSILNINLLQILVVCKGNSENNSDCGRFNYWGEILNEIKSKLLVIALGYKPGFIFIYWTIRILFHFENPLAPFRFSMRWESGQSPSLIGQKSLVFILHWLKLFRIWECTLDWLRFYISK